VVQPTANPASRNWSNADQLATEAADDGFNLIFDLNGCAVWACGTVNAAPTGTELTAYEGFVRAAVARYDPSSTFWAGKPSVPTITWQVWDEVNGGYFWPNPTPAAYAAFLSQITQTIHSVAPSANVIMSGLVGLPGSTGDGVALQPFLEGLFQQPGFTQSTDAIVVHGYATDPAGSFQILDEARQVMLQNNDAAQPIWVTEMGWASGGPASPFTVTPAQQNNYLLDSWDTMLACSARWNLQHVLWFSLQDEPASLFGIADYWGFHNGLLNVDGSAKPAYASFLQFIGSQPLPDGAGDTCTLPGGDTLGAGLNAVSGSVASTPQVTILSVRAITNKRRWQPVRFRATLAGHTVHGVRFLCSLDDRAWRRCRSPFNAASRRQGDNTLTVRGYELHSAVGVAAARVSWLVALRPPRTIITSHLVRKHLIVVYFHGVSPVGIARYQCRLSGWHHWHSCASPFVWYTTRAKRRRFSVRAIDRAGNIERRAAHVRLRITKRTIASAHQLKAGIAWRQGSFGSSSTGRLLPILSPAL
jgi:hypothetical protein